MVSHEQDDDDWNDEKSLPDQEDSDEDTILCPYCRREIHEDAERCPYCEHYISEEDTTPTAKPWWFVIGFLLCLVVIYLWIAG